MVRAQGTSPQRGFSPATSYAIADIESVNTTNGNVGLHIPIASLPAGRGGFPGLGLSLIYNSKLWDTPISIVPDGTYDIHDGTPNGRPQHYLKASPEGGWRYGAGYELRLINSLDDYTYSPLKPSCESQWGTGGHEADYIFNVQVIFPDGSAHDLSPQGYQNAANTTGNGYYNVRPDGYLTACSCTNTPMGPACQSPNPLILSNGGTMTYYSTDGTYLRLDVPHDADSNQWNNPWTMYMPDGSRVVGTGFTGVGSSLQPGYPGSERIYDRNNNYADVQITYNQISITDQLSRSITVERNSSPFVDYVHATGYNGEPLTWTVRWKNVYVNKTYRSDPDNGCPGTMVCTSNLNWTLKAIDGIDLPAQTGGLSYAFAYNGNSNPTDQGTPPSVGWGELSSVTLPSGAVAAYDYRRDNQNGINWYEILQNYPSSKRLTYQQEYDGASSPTTETWAYSFYFPIHDSTSSPTSVTGPDGGTTTDTVKPQGTSISHFDDGLSYKTTRPDGTVVERVWAANMPYGHYHGFEAIGNVYVKTEFTSIADASGNLSKTAIRDYSYDKNGNVTRVAEYDWVNYTDVPRGSDGRPTGQILSTFPLKRVTTNTYYNPTPDASDTTTDSPNSYSKASSAARRNSLASIEVGDGAGVLSRTEFTYDDPATTGNLTAQTSWDSTKGTYSNPLTASNSISLSYQYDSYGNRTLATDAVGHQTSYTYGAVGTVDHLYPTEVTAAYGTSVAETTTAAYDFYTGLVTRSTDANNVSTSTGYDVFGRPVLVKAADGLPEETRTQIDYSDAARRVITRKDLNAAGDGKLVSVVHYDQLGRVRLTRQLEDAARQSATDENAGVKVQHRYLYDQAAQARYQLTSNPYRASHSSDAGGESTMGWTLTASDQAGRLVRVESFGGAALPSPFVASNYNTNSLGAARTSYDAETMAVTDQAGKQRSSVSDGLGRLAQVIEAPSVQGYGFVTSYTYDALNNLTQVAQGAQTRTFAYSSLSRLKSTTNPEVCQQGGGQCVPAPVTYEYYANGNLHQKTDARGVTTIYSYDELNRVTSHTYNDGTPNVSYFYDSQELPTGAPSFSRGAAAGRLVAVTYGGGATGYYTGGYDGLGRAELSRQMTDPGTGEGPKTYEMSYSYDLAGNILTEMYPSGRVVKTEYDAAGRPAGVRNGESGPYYAGGTGTDCISYTSAGAVESLRLGNGLLEHTLFNGRLQPEQIQLGVPNNPSSKLQLEY
ncbi:MAG: RHS repeat protein, partial [Acidobacteriota bacterium]|nr:RHS repeat protein [Acidobacteriota bacterium]